jgi:hypothetical protein
LSKGVLFISLMEVMESQRCVCVMTNTAITWPVQTDNT